MINSESLCGGGGTGSWVAQARPLGSAMGDRGALGGGREARGAAVEVDASLRRRRSPGAVAAGPAGRGRQAPGAVAASPDEAAAASLGGSELQTAQ
jgi:hypothetical protein